jgi:DNA invertase Pin-like site-specific DNA recombinase
MSTESDRKVRREHLCRDAFIYVRQSSHIQILNNTESTARQYALRDRAVALGWPIERVHTIDDDQGRTAAEFSQRDGFESLLSEVAIGHAGILFGLEVSRLARNNAAWQRLLEVCALTGCLVGDEDGIYDPAHFNDRLLLGIKGTIAEAELHVLTARLVGAQRAKARRGELEVRLPIGLLYNAAGRVVLDPDPRIQASLQFIFDTFRQIRSAVAVTTQFRREGREFPRRIRRGNTQDVVFGPLQGGRIFSILHNPRYAGAYVYGRTPVRHTPGLTAKKVAVPRTQWQALIPNAHPGYISFEEFESNQQILEQNRAHSALRYVWSRERPRSQALLTGRVLCGTCGSRLQMRDDVRNGQRIRYYACLDAATVDAHPAERWFPAPLIDAAIGTLLLQTLTPAAVERAIDVAEEVRKRLEVIEAARRREIEQARARCELKRRRFLSCDPDHRLVADTLEADWNQALRVLDALQQGHEHHRHTEAARLDQESRSRLSSLVQDFPSIWNDPKADPAERRRLVGQLIEDVTLIHGDSITVRVRWRGGKTRSFTVDRPKPIAGSRKTAPDVIAALDALLETCSDCEAAQQLNASGHRTWKGQRFTNKGVRLVRLRYGLKSCRERWLAKGYLTTEQAAQTLGIPVTAVRQLARDGRLPCKHYDGCVGVVIAPLNGNRIVRDSEGRYRLTPPARTRKTVPDIRRTQPR